MKKISIKNFIGIIVLVTVTMFSFTACGGKNPFSGSSPLKSADKLDKELNGTWIGEEDTILTYKNGKWEFSADGEIVWKGTYTTSDGTITETITHTKIDETSKMYTKNEIEKDKSLAEFLEEFSPREIKYSINGNTLTEEFDDGETEVYTRK